MRISIALCTYNGARFLEAQLQSIAGQSRLPHELVVCDDYSQDSTCDILRTFSAHAPFPVRLHINAHNLGSTHNFERAISLCEGELIILCDQDDIWKPHKVERFEAIFADDRIGLAFSDAEIIDENGQPTGEKLWPCFGFDDVRQQRLRDEGFKLLLKKNVVTGATLAFRAIYKDWVLPIADGPLIHDAWIALLIAAVAPIQPIAEPLIGYRRHSGQQVGFQGRPQGTSCQTHHAAHLAQLEALYERLLTGRQVLSSIGTLEAARLQVAAALVRSQQAHLRARLGLPALRAARIPGILGELLTGHYHRYSNGFRSAASDFIR